MLVQSRDLPANPAALTPRWLTDALRAGGVLDTASVTEATVARVGPIEGFTSQLVRVHLRYDRPEPGAPDSLVAKLPHSDPTVSAWLTRIRVYERELRFYTELAPACRVGLPRVYYAARSDGWDAIALLLEDVGHLQPGDVIAGCSDAVAFRCAAELGRLHAAWWMSPRLEALDWLFVFADQADGAQEDYRQALPEFLARTDGRTTASVVELTKRLADHAATLRRRVGAPPYTLLHGDFHLGNILAAPDGSSITICDWASAARGRGPADLSWFVTLSLPTAQRRRIESPLIRHYHETLVDHGVEDYDLARCEADYELGLINDAFTTVFAISKLDLSGERGQAILERGPFKRWPDLIEDHHLVDRLPLALA